MNYTTSLDVFYSEIINILDNIHFFPIEINNFLFDKRFDDGPSSGRRYYVLFNEIKKKCKYSGETYHVCDSNDIDEDIVFGDYDYLIGYLNDTCPFLFQLPAYPFGMPERLILYDPKYQIEIDSSKPNIEVCEVNKSARDLFYLKPFDEKIKAIKNMLKNTDRPLLELMED